MIDDARALERVEAMNKANVENLARALVVERYLFQVYSHTELDTAYSPETGTLVVRYKVPGSNGLKNLVATIKRVMMETPTAANLSGTTPRIHFAGGFSVVA